ncbi:hypothetical protein, partial [Sphaerotilus mobilis]|uniref:hypothetical protein n=1 Tax=Sphaerotilus mobilis TaxID=47994 RepID=UPI0013EED258
AGYNFTTTDDLKIDALAADTTPDQVLNAAEKAAASTNVTISGTIEGSAEVKSSYNNDAIVVKLSKDGSSDITLSGVSYNASSGVWSGTVPTSSLSDGAWTITATSTAIGGGTVPEGTVTTAQRTFSVDTSLASPVLSLVADTGNASDGVTSNLSVNVSGIESGATWVYSTDGGTSWSSTPLASTVGSFTVPAPVVATGVTYDANKIVVKQTDAAGNVNLSTASGSVGAMGKNAAAWTFDNQKPNAPVVALGSGVAPGDGATAAEAKAAGAVTVNAEANAAVVVTYTGSAAGSTAVTKNVTGTGSVQNVPALTDGEIADLKDGTITVSVVATDKAGNASDAGTSSFVLDTVAPVVNTVTDTTVAGVTKDAIDFYVTFSEALRSTPTTGHFSATNGAVTSVGVVAGVANQYKVTVTPTADVASGNVAL